MSAIPHSIGNNREIGLKNPFIQLLRYLKGLFSCKETGHVARLYHGDLSYELVPDTAISNFHNIKKATSLYTGDGFVTLFDQPNYQGGHRIIAPGQRVDTAECNSLIISTRTFSIDAVRRRGQPPEWCWEFSGPMYVMHFYRAYRYA